MSSMRIKQITINRSTKLKKYETVFILDERKVQDEGKAFAEEFSSAISGAGGEMVSVTPLGRRQFAREIKKRKAGIYYDFVFNAEESFVKALPEQYKLDERTLRVQVFVYDRPENQIKASEAILQKETSL